MHPVSRVLTFVYVAFAAALTGSSFPGGAAPRSPMPTCVGDCDASGTVTIDELLIVVGTALGPASPLQCEAGDLNGDAAVTVDEIVAAVDRALRGCPATPSPTPTRVFPTPTRQVFEAPKVPAGLDLADVDEDGSVDLVAAINPSFAAVLRGRGDGSFDAARFFEMGEEPSDLFAGDLNGDGHVDLVTANESSIDISVRLGAGDGTFGPHVRYAVADLPAQLAVADLDNDGAPDLVTVATSGLSILLGIGDGRFQEVTTAGDPSAYFADSIGIADMTADGILDLIASASGEVLVFAGMGDGAFHPPRAVFPNFFETFAVTDLNGDERPDIVASDEATIAVLLGAEGSLSVTSTLPVDSPGSISASDVDGDSKTDLVVLGSAGHVFYRGRGDGSFHQAQIHLLGAEGAFTIGDVDGDSAAELIAGGEESIVIAAGNDAGRLLAPVFVPSTSVSYVVAAGNFIGSSDVDLLIAEDYSSGRLSWLAGAGKGSLGPVMPIREAPIEYTAAVAGDLNRDGFLDVVVASRDGIFAGHLSIVLGSAGEPVALEPISLETAPVSAAAADFDGDGFLDVVVSDSFGGLTHLRGVGDGTLNPGVVTELTEVPDALIVTGADAGASPDLVTLTYDGSSADPTTKLLRLSAAASGFFEPTEQLVVNQGVLDVADFNRDGRLDVVAASPTADAVVVLLANADGSVSERMRFPTQGFLETARVGDFNDDGSIDDLLVVDYGGEAVQLSLYFARSNGGFLPRQQIDLPCDPSSILTPDLDGDGNLDIVMGTEDCDGLLAYFGRPNGGFAEPRKIAVVPPAESRPARRASFTSSVSGP